MESAGKDTVCAPCPETTPYFVFLTETGIVPLPGPYEAIESLRPISSEHYPVEWFSVCALSTVTTLPTPLTVGYFKLLKERMMPKRWQKMLPSPRYNLICLSD